MKIIFGSAQLMSDYGINKDDKNLKIPKLKEIFKFLKDKKLFILILQRLMVQQKKLLENLLTQNLRLLQK